jgi:hypothetical protein
MHEMNETIPDSEDEMEGGDAAARDLPKVDSNPYLSFLHVDSNPHLSLLHVDPNPHLTVDTNLHLQLPPQILVSHSYINPA